ncbi:MAG: DUF1015 family protein [Chthoniobacter sp.]|uniref:DUF1015 domain-containing protein n=1 Tax=Chthoniobacter sp. TaxID=2510640 RepID=UPI0032AD4E9A
MLRIKAFQGLRPTPPLVTEVACVPYDVVNREESAALAAGHPHSLLHVDRAEIDLPPETDPYSDAVYAKARENFLGLQEEGALIRETEPCVYLYQQRMGSHVQVGVATVCHIEDYERDIIKKHEKTRRDKEDDRTRLIGTISADTGPVFLTYRDSAAIDALVADVQKDTPLYDFTAPDGVQHTVWRVAGAKAFVEAFGNVPVSYVADGHHRTASAARVGRELREANPAHTGNEEYNWFLAVLFPASQLQILPYNRAVKELNGQTKEAFLEAVGRAFTVLPNGSPTPKRPGEIRMYLDGAWYDLAWQPAVNADPISQLDVTGLQDRLLAPLLGIDDPRTSKRVDFIGGIRGTDELVKLVDAGQAAVAFSMYPTTVDQLMAIADANQIMPPKSTWFEPKLRSGLFIHTF